MFLQNYCLLKSSINWVIAYGFGLIRSASHILVLAAWLEFHWSYQWYWLERVGGFLFLHRAFFIIHLASRYIERNSIFAFIYVGFNEQNQLSLIRGCTRQKNLMFSGLHSEEVCQHLLNSLQVQFCIVYLFYLLVWACILFFLFLYCVLYLMK